MVTFIMTILLYRGGVAVQPYANEESCVAAKHTILEAYQRRDQGALIVITCTPYRS